MRSPQRRKLRLQRQASTGASTQNIFVTILVALISLAGTAYLGYRQGLISRELEQQKLQTSLILKAVETGDQEEARTNLLFFIDTGLLSDPDGRLRKKLIEDADGTAFLPSSITVTGTTPIRPFRTMVEISLTGRRVKGDISINLLNVAPPKLVQTVTLSGGEVRSVPLMPGGTYGLEFTIVGAAKTPYTLSVRRGDESRPSYSVAGNIPATGRASGSLPVRVEQHPALTKFPVGD